MTFFSHWQHKNVDDPFLVIHSTQILSFAAQTFL